MQLSCTQSDLARALSIVNRAVQPNNTLPVLNNILLRAEKGQLFLSATNLEISISALIPAPCDQEGAITLPAKTITSYVGLLGEQNLNFSLDGENTLRIQGQGSQTMIKGLSAEEFPLPPDVADSQRLELPTGELREALDLVTFAASTNISRPILTGIVFDFSENKLTLASTDSYRLAEHEVDLGVPVENSSRFIIPARTAQELSKILASTNKDSFGVLVAKGQVRFEVDEIVLMSRLIEGSYPDYKKILPEQSATKMVVPREELLMALKRVSVIVKDHSNNVRLSVEPDKLRMYTEETQVGQGEAVLNYPASGEHVEVALNVQYLMDVLAHLKGDEVELGLNDKLSPVKVVPVKSGGYTHIIMPLKL